MKRSSYKISNKLNHLLVLNSVDSVGLNIAAQIFLLLKYFINEIGTLYLNPD